MSDNVKKYYEIYPIEEYVKKTKAYLTDVCRDQPNMYKKTIERYGRLAQDLVECSELVLQIYDNAVQNNINKEVEKSRQMVEDMYSKFNLLIDGQIYFTPGKNEKSNGINLHEYNRGVEYNMSKQLKGQTLGYFDNVLHNMSIHNFGYVEVNECSQLLYKWFHTRFKPLHKDTQFKYKLEYIPLWIDYFLLVYGRACKEDNRSYFYSKVDSWCQSVVSGSNHKYALPYDVFKVTQKSDPSDFTMDAVVIHDILFDEFLYMLTEYEFNGAINLDPDSLIKLVRDNNPSLQPKLTTRIARRNDLIKEINLTAVGGIDEDE